MRSPLDDRSAAIARAALDLMAPMSTAELNRVLLEAAVEIVRLTRQRDEAHELLAEARRSFGAGEHDCTGPQDCWTCAVDETLKDEEEP